MDRPPPEDIARVTAALGVRPIAWEPATRGGQTAAARWLVTLPDAARAFVKIGATLDTAAWIRDEHRVYAQLRGRSFLPRMLGFHDDGERPALAIEDLSGARWPPPWEPEAVTAVLACLDEVHATPPPTDLPSIGQLGLELRGTWDRIAEAPTPLLGLGLCDASWLEAALPVLESATRRAVIEGDALLHMDVRSDNLCLRDGRAVLVDWNWACTGNPMFEIAGWLPSLHDEGGPPPQEILPSGAAEMAALLAGYFCSHAGLPPISGAPHVRHLQLRQARIALPWAARELGLPLRGERPVCTCNCSLHCPPMDHVHTIVGVANGDVMEMLRTRGLRMTPQRHAIVSEVMRTPGHISPAAIARKIQGEMPGVNASTVYRTLSLLEEVGVLQHSHLESGAEYHRSEEAAHVHLTCSRCGSEDALSLGEAESLHALIRTHHGFEADLTHFAIGGLCRRCAKTVAAPE